MSFTLVIYYLLQGQSQVLTQTGFVNKTQCQISAVTNSNLIRHQGGEVTQAICQQRGQS